MVQQDVGRFDGLVGNRQSMEDQGVRIADALDPDQLDDARVGNGQQHVRLMVKPNAIVVGQGSFVDQIRLLVARDQHRMYNYMKDH
jgi:hypothetical protein